MCFMGQSPFYDDIAEYYDLIYADWEATMRRHGAAISEMFQVAGLSGSERGLRILDVSAGIGTQALPLASLGYDVVARDLSSGAITRLSREAEERGLTIDTAQADMSEIADSVDGLFDAVIAFDNSIPHLLSDAEIGATFDGLSRLLTPDGALLISVRDYDEVDRAPTSVHPHGERTRGGQAFRLGQEWAWLDDSHYRTTMVVEKFVGGTWIDVVETDAEYYAISIPRLLELMEGAGLRPRRVEEVPFFQPVLYGVLASTRLLPSR